MTGKLFRNCVAVAATVMLLSIALVLGVLYQYYGEQLKQELMVQTALVAQGLEMQGEDYLDRLDTENRLTWIGVDGTVLYDSWADAAQMENHGDRKEVREAMTSGSGTAARYSSTLSVRTLYCTQRLSDGSVIRLSDTQRTAAMLLLTMAQPILVILILSLVLSLVLASRLSRRIIQPILTLDLEHPEHCHTYEELHPLLERIRCQNETIRRQMDDLRRQQQEFSALTGHMSEGFLLLDVQGWVLSYNPSALRLLGVTPPQGEFSARSLCGQEPFLRAVEGVLEGRGGEYVLQSEERVCKLLANPVMQRGEPTGGVLVLLDVTEQERREELRREFSANVSHELKTPLTSIFGFAEIMKDGLVPAEDMPGFAADIYKETRRLIALVEDIMRLSQLDEGAVSEEWEDVDLLALSQETKELLQPAAERAGVSVLVEGEPGVVRGVRNVLEQMVYNLCDNAIKYNRTGGTVTVAVNWRGERTVLSVSDTGIGIPEADRKRVFERFYRVDKSHSRAIGGTGLGLSIVKHGAALHNAELELESQEGQGTTIRVVFRHSQ